MINKEFSWELFIHEHIVVVCRLLTEAKDFLDKCIEKRIIESNTKEIFLKEFDYNTCYFMTNGVLNHEKIDYKLINWNDVITQKNTSVLSNDYKLKMRNKNNDIYTFICYVGIDNSGKHKVMLYDDLGGIWIAPIDELMVVV